MTFTTRSPLACLITAVFAVALYLFGATVMQVVPFVMLMYFVILIWLKVEYPEATK
jgi:hypothetical protein